MGQVFSLPMPNEKLVRLSGVGRGVPPNVMEFGVTGDAHAGREYGLCALHGTLYVTFIFPARIKSFAEDEICLVVSFNWIIVWRICFGHTFLS